MTREQLANIASATGFVDVARVLWAGGPEADELVAVIHSILVPTPPTPPVVQRAPSPVSFEEAVDWLRQAAQQLVGATHFEGGKMIQDDMGASMATLGPLRNYLSAEVDADPSMHLAALNAVQLHSHTQLDREAFQAVRDAIKAQFPQAQPARRIYAGRKSVKSGLEDGTHFEFDGRTVAVFIPFSREGKRASVLLQEGGVPRSAYQWDKRGGNYPQWLLFRPTDAASIADALDPQYPEAAAAIRQNLPAWQREAGVPVQGRSVGPQPTQPPQPPQPTTFNPDAGTIEGWTYRWVPDKFRIDLIPPRGAFSERATDFARAHFPTAGTQVVNFGDYVYGFSIPAPNVPLVSAGLRPMFPAVSAVLDAMFPTWVAVKAELRQTKEHGTAEGGEWRFVAGPQGKKGTLYLKTSWVGKWWARIGVSVRRGGGGFPPSEWVVAVPESKILRAVDSFREQLPRLAEALTRTFGGIARVFEEEDEVCAPLIDMAGKVDPATVTNPTAVAAIEHVRRAFEVRAPVDFRPLPFQEIGIAFAKLTGYRALIGDSMGLGKLQPDDAPVLTPTGWVRIDELNVDDSIIDPDGGSAKVTGIFPKGVKQQYRVGFSDGTSTECGLDHLWLVQSASQRASGGHRVIDLRQIQAEGLRDGNGNSRHFIPICAPVEYDPPETELPLDPYLLGVLIGDGGLTGNSPRLANPDDFILTKIEGSLPTGCRLNRGDDGLNHTIAGIEGVNPLLSALRELGLMGCYSTQKAIPTLYRSASVPDRLALLRGLMDTDGDCTVGGVCTFNTSSPQLEGAVTDLVRGLGGIATTSYRSHPKYMHNGEIRVGSPAWRINVRLAVNPFTLPRKADRWKAPILAKSIRSIEPTRAASCRCIRVSSKRSLYVTDQYIVTHNTAQALGAILADPEELLPAIIVVPKNVLGSWVKHARKWLPSLPVQSVSTVSTQLPPKGWKGAVLTSWDIMRERLGDLVDWEPSLVVWDEAHYGKNPSAMRTRAMLELAKAAPHVLLLTGTPVTNDNIVELWPLLHAVSPENWGTRAAFVNKFVAEVERILTEHGGIIEKFVGVKAEDELKKRLACTMIRRLKSAALPFLPPKTRTVVEVDMSKTAWADYREAQRRFEEWLHNAVSSALRAEGVDPAAASEAAVAKVQKALKAKILTQIGALRVLTGRAKVEHAIRLAEPVIARGQPIIIWCYFKEVVDTLIKAFGSRYRLAVITGDVGSAADRSDIEDRFQDGQIDVLIATTAAKEGLTLTRANTALFVERFWTPAAETQAEDRIHRIGQTREAFIYTLHIPGTIDEFMSGLVERKRAFVDQVIGSEDEDKADPDVIDSEEEAVTALVKGALRQRKNPGKVAKRAQEPGSVSVASVLSMIRRSTGPEGHIDKLHRGEVVQTVLIPRRWSEQQAKHWLTVNGYRVVAPDLGAAYARFRQADPASVDRTTFRTVRIGNGGPRLVVARPIGR